MPRITTALHLLSALLLTGLSGCNVLFAGLVLGLKNTPTATPARVAAEAARYGVPADKVFVLDTSYLRFVRQQSVARHDDDAKNHSQPLQLQYFTPAGQLTSFYINCYADMGCPYLRWNPDGRLNVFPPRTQIPPDSLLPFPQLLRFLRTPEGQPVAPTRFANGNRKVVLFWSRTMGRQTKGLLRELEQNLTHVPPGETVDVLYVNNDAYMKLLE